MVTRVRADLAMGTFLRVWRREWAGLSRAQLARAVSSAVNGKPEVSPATVRHWEEGQPPQTAKELDALLRVMRRHWLTDPEIADFRRTVLAATASRQYPDLFDTEGFAQRRDVEEAAVALAEREHLEPCSVSIVHLVVLLEELRCSLTADAALTGSSAQFAAQRRALAMLLFANGCHGEWSGRGDLAFAHRLSLAEVAEACYGAHGLEHTAARTSLATLRAREFFHRSYAGQGSVWARRALEFSQNLIGSPDHDVGVWSFFGALFCLSRQRELRFEWDTFRPLIGLRLAQARDSEKTWPEANYGLVVAAINARQWDVAERAFEGLEVFGRWQPDMQTCRLRAAGDLALNQGHTEEAERHFAAAVALGRQHGMGIDEDLARLDRCGAASESGRSPG